MTVSQELSSPAPEAEPLSELAEQAITVNLEAVERVREGLMFTTLKLVPSPDARFQTPVNDYSGNREVENPNDAMLAAFYSRINADVDSAETDVETDERGVIRTTRSITVPLADKPEQTVYIVESFAVHEHNHSLKVTCNRYGGHRDA